MAKKSSLTPIDGDKKNESIGVEIGRVGTEIFSGYLDVDYSPEWNSLQSKCEVIEKMVDGDGTVSALLDAIKNPILSANFHFECEDENLEEFAERAIFKELRTNFKQFLIESMTFIEYGFSLFEKVYKVKDGLIFYDRFAPRIQKSVQRWATNSGKWENGHPDGITQYVVRTDDAKENSGFSAEIPWDKLLRFTMKQIGNNFEGKSILRRANVHFKIKQLLYRISGISAERFGVGVPYIKHKAGLNQNIVNKYTELVKNIRSNEQSYAVFDTNVEEFGIMVPGNGKGNDIQKLIDHHDKKMYDSILAGFLNLTSGDGGSNALSKDQSSFFLRNLQYIADYMCEVIDDCVKDLIIKNFGEQEFYPKLICSDIGSISLDEFINSMATAKSNELVTWGDDDQKRVREQLKLGKMPEKDAQDIEAEKLQTELDQLSIESDTLPEDNQDTATTKEEFCEFFGEEFGENVYEFVAAGGHLTDEHKKKISEALSKALPSDSTEKKPSERSQKSALNKQFLQQGIANLKTKLSEYDAKRRTMDRKQKKVYNAMIRTAVEAMKKKLEEFKQGVKRSSDVIKEEYKAARSDEKKAKQAEKIKNAIDKEDARRSKVSSRIDQLKTDLNSAKTENQKARIQDKIKVAENSMKSSKYGFSEILFSDIKDRERVFMKNIADFENYLESEYSNILKVVETSEQKMRSGLSKMYNQAETQRKDGVMKIASSSANRKLSKEMQKFVDSVADELDAKLVDSTIQERLFEKAKKMSVQSLVDNEKFFKEIQIDEQAFMSMIDGYISNTRAFLFNEPRRVKEQIVLNFGSQVSFDLAAKQIDGLQFNRNILKLSTLTHARGAYNLIQYNQNVKDGFTFFKVVAPKQKFGDIAPNGMTASLLFLILTAAEINRRVNEDTDGKNTDALSGLNLHHGAYVYFYPISSDQLDEEKVIAEEQRTQFLESIQPNNESGN